MSESSGTSAIRAGDRFTLAQWWTWPEGERWELIGGIAFAMSPVPKVVHQEIALKFAYALKSFLEGKPCKAFISPIDVFLPDADPGTPDTVVQPDVIVVCDPAKIGEEGIHGAPDLVAEILSDSTAYKDLTVKKAAYERSGVREYWIINPESGSILRHVLSGGAYLPAVESRRGEAAESAVLEGFRFGG